MGLVAAPAVIRVADLMPISVLPEWHGRMTWFVPKLAPDYLAASALERHLHCARLHFGREPIIRSVVGSYDETAGVYISDIRAI